MKANEANLLSLMKGPKQYVIPIYQRTYSWKQKHCEQLLKDILRIGKDEESQGHFIGSIVYFRDSIYTSSEVPKNLVIDGQQRLTTISLLLAALLDTITTQKIEIDINPKKIRNYFLINSEEEDELKYKLILTRKDKEALINILENRNQDDSVSRNVMKNYNYFLSQINKDNAEHVYYGIQKLFIVDVVLEKGKDNPQLIFESLNSTGLDLSQADLIRNYILMDQLPEIQKELYESYWYPMEKLFGDYYAEYFDWFVRDYLTLKTGKIPKIGTIYAAFKSFITNNGKPVDLGPALADLYKYAQFYVKISLLEEADKKLYHQFSNLKALKVDVSFPFILACIIYMKRKVSALMSL